MKFEDKIISELPFKHSVNVLNKASSSLDPVMYPYLKRAFEISPNEIPLSKACCIIAISSSSNRLIRRTSSIPIAFRVSATNDREIAFRRKNKTFFLTSQKMIYFSLSHGCLQYLDENDEIKKRSNTNLLFIKLWYANIKASSQFCEVTPPNFLSASDTASAVMPIASRRC